MRLIVVHSSALEAKALHREEARITQDQHRLDRALKVWTHRTFSCEADAQQAWDAWSATKSVRQAAWEVSGTLVPPAPNTDAPWTIQATRATKPRQDWLEAERFRRSPVILVSNDPRRSPRELLTAYKTPCVNEQDHAMV